MFKLCVSNKTSILYGQMMNVNNSSDLIQYHRQRFADRHLLETDIFKATVAIGVVNSVWIIFGNLLLLCVVLSSRRLRSAFRNQMLVNLALSDLLIGFICIPLKVDFALNQGWKYGCTLHVVYQVIELYLQIFVGSVCVVILNFDYIFERLQGNRPNLSRKWKTAFTVQLLALPWVFACIIIFPTIFINLHPMWTAYMWTDNYCPFRLLKTATVTLTVLCYFLPAFIILSQVVTILVIFCKKRPEGVASLGLLTYSDSARDTAVFIVAGLVTVIFLCGEQVWFVLAESVGSTMTYKASMITDFVFGAVADTKSAMLPLVWLALPDLWDNVKSNLRWRPWRHYVQHRDIEVTYYRNYGDDLGP